MNRPREYSKRKLFHACISERLLKVVAALPKFQGGVLCQLQRFHENTVKRVWMNCLPPGSNLYLETISLPVILTFEEWREIQGKFAKELSRYRAKGSIHTPDDNKVNETIENINNATVHSKSWSDFGYISFKEAKSFLADATDVVNVRLFSFSKGHIFIVYQVHLSETLKSELNSYFQLQFPVMTFLIPTLKHFLRHWGLRSENGIFYKRFKVQERLNSIRKKLHNEISKKLHLPVRDSYPISSVDIYVLNSVEKNIFQSFNHPQCSCAVRCFLFIYNYE